MKIILFSRTRIRHVADEIRQIFAAAAECGFEVAVNEEFAPMAEQMAGVVIPAGNRYGARIGRQSSDAVMICCGGDGTLLEGASRLDGEPVPVVGVNSGHLGFLTSVPKGGIAEIFGLIRRGELKTEERTMISAEGFAGGTRYALNELSIQRRGASMVSAAAYVDGEMVATYHGDGVIISTPTGSTAYSLSAGGPVVAPQCRCFVLSPIAPHNLTMRAVVVPDTSRITLRLLSPAGDAFCSLDNRTEALAEGAEIEVSLAARRIFLAVPHNISFYDTLRNKMMWGVDVRS
ncbi:MAG: NAD(+)/NADH kinase [Alistipes sp.]|nr:NAD(+)/NADH kinase [Alistipes sp.]